MTRKAQQNDSAPASLDILILWTLSLRDLHGYGIVQFIQQSSGKALLLEEGSLYPALQRLELNGWIDGVWGVTSNHRRARIYKITEAGRKLLAAISSATSNVHVDNAPAANLKGARSRLLCGCVVTAVAFGQQPSNAPSGGIPVNVCMEPTQGLIVSTTMAESLASEIFSEIGVNLTWRTVLSDCDDLPGQPLRTAFKIRWAERAPYTSRAGALAAAHPFASSGTSITIYEVPLERFIDQYGHAPEVVLAYVLAHELAHVMQGLDYHSASGILKATWSYREYYMMLSRTLTFTARDADLIRTGLEAKRSNIASRKDAPQNRSASSTNPSSINLSWPR